MKNIKSILFVFLSLTLAFPPLASAQDAMTAELSYEVNKIYPHLSISKEKLKEVQTIVDIKNEANGRNLQYKSSWVRSFIAVEILTSHNGVIRKAVSPNDTLSQEQKDNLHTADLGTDVSIRVQYIPENTLKQNDPKELTYTFVFSPENDAAYPDGADALNKYLQKEAMDKISASSFQGYDMRAVKFTINEAGEVTNAHLFGEDYLNDKKEEVNELLLNAVRKMACWEPATFSDGTKVAQEYVLTVGNMENCMVHTLNIRRE